MIGIHAADDTRLAITYNGLTLNNPADQDDDTYEINTIVYGSQFDQAFDSDPAGDGSEVGNVRRSMLIVRMDGTLRAPTIAGRFDKAVALAKAFDPALAAYKNAVQVGITPANWGVLPMDFFTPTADTANYPAGVVSSRYYARSRGGVYVPISQFTGYSGFFSIELAVPEARRYWLQASTKTNSGVLDNSLADYPSLPTLTITMTGAGNAAFTVSRVGTYSTQQLVLNLSGLVNGNVVTVDMKNKRIYLGTVETPSLYVSGTYWEIEPTSQTITVTNSANASLVTTWRRAWTA